MSLAAPAAERTLDRLLVISTNYPSPTHPTQGTFVQALMHTFAREGVEVKVISPRKHWDRAPDGSEAVSPSACIEVRRPGFVSLSAKRIGPLSSVRLAQPGFDRAVRVAARACMRDFQPQAIYGHFVVPSGVGALRLARRLGVPAFLSMSENLLPVYLAHHGEQRLHAILRGFRGILAASPDNRRYCIDEVGYPEERLLTLPNAADPARFEPRDRDAMRRKHGLPLDRPIAIFVGTFNENKGADRLAQALEHVPEMGGVFLGSGPVPPNGPQVLHRGRVPHDDVPEWLSAADVFVLPSLAECSSNALAEAAAAGLPVVSSDILNTRAMVDPAWAVLVDPTDPAAIGGALAELARDPEKRARMSAAALAHARSYTIQDRARRILEWMGELALDAGPRG